MLFGRKIDDPAWTVELDPGLHEHATDPNFVGFTGGFVSGEIFRETLLEHERDAFAHDSDRVHGVDHRVNTGIEQITLGEAHHVKNQVDVVLTVRASPRAAIHDSSF